MTRHYDISKQLLSYCYLDDGIRHLDLTFSEKQLFLTLAVQLSSQPLLDVLCPQQLHKSLRWNCYVQCFPGCNYQVYLFWRGGHICGKVNDPTYKQTSCVRQSVSQVFNSTEKSDIQETTKGNSEVTNVVYDIILLPTCIFEMWHVSDLQDKWRNKSIMRNPTWYVECLVVLDLERTGIAFFIVVIWCCWFFFGAR